MQRKNEPTTFQKIYRVVSKIPKGKVMTYKQIAIDANVKNARVVGFAMRCNKDTTSIPCHRVVSSDGELRGYAYGGITQKKEMLEKEGVQFLNKTAVDLEKSLYQPHG